MKRFALALTLALAGLARAEEASDALSDAVGADAAPAESAPAPAVAAEEAGESAGDGALFDAVGADAPAPLVAAPSPESVEPAPATPPASLPEEPAIVIEPAKDKPLDGTLAAEDDEELIELSTPPSTGNSVAGADTDFGLEVGWNSPAAQGIRLLRHVEGTDIAVGVGLALRTFWGPKVSVLVRNASDFQEGLFWQASLAFSTEGTFEQQVGDQVATFEQTAGRTIDGIAGYRFRTAGAGYVDLFAGWSLNIRGVALQTADKPEQLVRLDDDAQTSLWVRRPGGFVFGANYGWLF